jgi:membrane-associated PAP2 superfamily phosphatase
LVAVGAAFWPLLRPWRAPGLFFGAMLLLGPGLLVNVTFKDNWGRPRPTQVDCFGGKHAFRPVWEPGEHGHCRSFPCGHASMGFFLMGPAFLLYRRRPRLAGAFLLLGLSAGLLLGATRIVQGRHFASDVLWSAGFVYFTGLALGYLYHRWTARASAGTADDADVLPMPAERRDYPQAA